MIKTEFLVCVNCSKKIDVCINCTKDFEDGEDIFCETYIDDVTGKDYHSHLCDACVLRTKAILVEMESD